jgi:hypothetical protein
MMGVNFWAPRNTSLMTIPYRVLSSVCCVVAALLASITVDSVTRLVLFWNKSGNGGYFN